MMTRQYAQCHWGKLKVGIVVLSITIGLQQKENLKNMALPRNPNRSGGPRSVAGIQAVSANAIKAGAYAAQVVLPGEDAGQFEDLEAQLMRDFGPIGMAEVAMVHDLAVLTWKRLRVDRVEHSVMLQMMQSPISEDSLATSFGPGFMSRAMFRLEPYSAVTSDELKETMDLVAQLEAVDKAPESRVKMPVMRRKWPRALAALEEWAHAYNVALDDVLADGLGDGLTFSDAIQELLDNAKTLMWLGENQDAIEAAIRRVRDTRLLQYMKSNTTQRAYDDIGRAFYRTLAELRRQQDWRMRRSAVEVDEVTPKPAPANTDASGGADFPDQTNSHSGGLLK